MLARGFDSLLSCVTQRLEDFGRARIGSDAFGLRRRCFHGVNEIKIGFGPVTLNTQLQSASGR